MATTIDQLYGEEHWDSGYYQSLLNYYATQHWTNGLEIGFAWAMSAMAFLETQPDAKLTSIDMNDTMGKVGKMQDVYGERFNFIQGDSVKTMKTLGKFDYIYIDGDHTYEGCKRDLEEAVKHLKATGGVIICDDYGNPCGVKQAVDEFCTKHGFDGKLMDGNPNGGIILCRQ